MEYKWIHKHKIHIFIYFFWFVRQRNWLFLSQFSDTLFFIIFSIQFWSNKLLILFTKEFGSGTCKLLMRPFLWVAYWMVWFFKSNKNGNYFSVFYIWWNILLMWKFYLKTFQIPKLLLHYSMENNILILLTAILLLNIGRKCWIINSWGCTTQWNITLCEGAIGYINTG
jgi:hypothetical protein